MLFTTTIHLFDLDLEDLRLRKVKSSNAVVLHIVNQANDFELFFKDENTFLRFSSFILSANEILESISKGADFEIAAGKLQTENIF